MLKIIGSASGKHLDAMDFTKVQRCELVWEGKEEFLEHCFEQVPRLQYCTVSSCSAILLPKLVLLKVIIVQSLSSAACVLRIANVVKFRVSSVHPAISMDFAPLYQTSALSIALHYCQVRAITPLYSPLLQGQFGFPITLHRMR
jgi:hypothetical protein